MEPTGNDTSLPHYDFVGIQRDRAGRDYAYMFTDKRFGSTVTVPINDPFSVYERIVRLREGFEKA